MISCKKKNTLVPQLLSDSGVSVLQQVLFNKLSEKKYQLISVLKDLILTILVILESNKSMAGGFVIDFVQQRIKQY